MNVGRMPSSTIDAAVPSSGSPPADGCPFWKRGYCQADRACKFVHDPSQGGQLQESYLSQIRGTQRAPAPRPQQQAYPTPSAMASAVYGGGQQMMYGYGYYGQPMMAQPVMIGAPMQSNAMPPKNFKTLPCRHFIRGHCMRGDSCGFRHGEGEAPGAPPNYGQLPPDLANPVHPGRPFKVVTCRRWLQGSCMLGDRCTFRHDFDTTNNQQGPMMFQQQPALGVKRSLSPDRPPTAPHHVDREPEPNEKLQRTVG